MANTATVNNYYFVAYYLLLQVIASYNVCSIALSHICKYNFMYSDITLYMSDHGSDSTCKGAESAVLGTCMREEIASLNLNPGSLCGFL